MKSKIIGKKQLLTLSLACAFGLAVFVNWYYTKSENNNTEPDISQKYNLGDAQLVNSSSVEEDDFFSEAVINRTKSHDEAINNLEEIISDKESDKETVELARKELVEISQQIKTETDIENLIKAQLDVDCLVTYNNDKIDIIMPPKTLDADSVIKIKDIVLSKSDLTSDDIVIIESK